MFKKYAIGFQLIEIVDVAISPFLIKNGKQHPDQTPPMGKVFRRVVPAGVKLGKDIIILCNDMGIRRLANSPLYGMSFFKADRLLKMASDAWPPAFLHQKKEHD
jgi:hypothetical protein